MSVYQILIAKVENKAKLGTPYVVFDFWCNQLMIPKKIEQITKDKKIIKSDVQDYLNDEDVKNDSFIQKDYLQEKLMKTIYFKTDSRNLVTKPPTYILYFAWITDLSINESKVGNFLKDIHRCIFDNYDPEAFDTKTDLNTEFVSVCCQIIDNYNMGSGDTEKGANGPIIKFDNIRLGGKKLDKLKEKLIDNVKVMAMNIEGAENLEAESQQLKENAFQFKKRASEGMSLVY